MQTTNQRPDFAHRMGVCASTLRKRRGAGRVRGWASLRHLQDPISLARWR